MLTKYLGRYLARFISSHLATELRLTLWQLKQHLLRHPNQIELYLKADDPYSYLLAQVLPKFYPRFDLKWRIFIVDKLPTNMYPEPNLWRQHALTDARQLASLYQLDFDSQSYPSEPAINQATAQLLQVQLDSEKIGLSQLNSIKEIFTNLWHDDIDAPHSKSINLQQLTDNERKLIKRHHYLSASLFYQGQWFWGLDRLDHLERLLHRQQSKERQGKVLFNRTYCHFCSAVTIGKTAKLKLQQPITLYFSIRSPYSHLALERCVTLAKHYGIPLNLKPVIPMLMRGLSVPRDKTLYIFLDAKREATKLGINYGFVADPLGAGVKRCYALFEYAKAQGKEVEYLLSFSRAVNAEGIMAQSDRGLKHIVSRAGLDWQQTKALLCPEQLERTWSDCSKANQQELTDMGFWGVPVIKYGDVQVWGQDRLFVIEQHIKQTLFGQSSY